MSSGARDREEFALRVAIAIALVGAAVALSWAIYLARHALLLIYVSVLLAIGFGPVVRAVEHQKWVGVGRLPRWLAILVVYLVIVGTLVLIGVLVIPPLVHQAGDLWAEIPRLSERVQRFLVDRGLMARTVTLGEAVRNAPAAASGTAAAVGTAAVAVTWTASLVFQTITVLILTFYLLIDSATLFAGFARFFSRENRPRVMQVAQEISIKVSAWLSGQLILAGTIGVTAAAALWVLGVPYFYVLALIAAIGEMIPVLGPFLSAIPAILVALTVSPQTGLYVAVFWLLQQQVENHVLVPKIMQRQVGVSPVTVIVALMVGGSLLGILGAVLAVPTAAIIQVVILELLDEGAGSERTRPTPS